jgi:predicted alpha/beta superfamily hydrolase
MEFADTSLYLNALGTEYQVSVRAPRTSGRHPVLLVMDGDDLFAPLVVTARELINAGQIPPMILAGVGYGGSFRSPQNRRGRDYTPTRLAGEPSETGGAANFAAFLKDKLLPELSARFQTDQIAPGIAGHSLGSLFALYALFQPAPLFRNFLVSSPSIWWDDRAVLKQAAVLRERQSSLPARLFLSVGVNDSESMTGDLKLLEEKLATAQWSELDYTVQRLADRDHYNVVPDAYRAGLLWLYGPKSPAT